MTNKAKLLVKASLAALFGLLMACHSSHRARTAAVRVDSVAAEARVSQRASEQAAALRLSGRCEVVIDSPEVLRADSPRVLVRARRMVVRAAAEGEAAAAVHSSCADSVRAQSAVNKEVVESEQIRQSRPPVALWVLAAAAVAFILLQSFARIRLHL